MLPSPKHIFEQNPIKPVGFMIPEMSFFSFFLIIYVFFSLQGGHGNVKCENVHTDSAAAEDCLSDYLVWKFLLVLFFL